VHARNTNPSRPGGRSADPLYVRLYHLGVRDPSTHPREAARARDRTSRPLASALLRRYGWWVFDKLQVVDICESQQDFDRFGETLIADPSEIGLDPGQPMVEPVHNLIPG
jgi:hypothetical protein